MKKYLILFFFVITCGCLTVNAKVISHRTGFYMYVNGTMEEILLYEEEESHKPVYRLAYDNETYNDSNYRETSKISLTEEELEKIKKYISIITEGKAYSELSYHQKFTPQILIWQMWQEKTGVPLSYTFDVGFVKNYETVLEQITKPEIYTFETRIDEPLSINFLPIFQAPYIIKPMDNNFTINQNGNKFEIIPDKVGSFQFKIESSYFDEIVKYYAFEDSEMISLIKSKIPNSEIHLTVNEPLKENHHISVAENSSIEISTEKESFAQGEKVKLVYTLKEGYLLDSIEVYSNGIPLTVENDEFIMPDNDVIVITNTNPIPIYKINAIVSEGVIVSLPNELIPGNKIDLDYKLPDNEKLLFLQVITESGIKLDVSENQFVMPEENVILEIYTEKIKTPIYDIYNMETPGIKILVNQEAKAGETVELKYQLLEDYEFLYFGVYTKNNSKIDLDDLQFIMPEENVFVKAYVKKKEITKNPSHKIITPIIEGIRISIPNESLKNEPVAFKYELEPNYILEELSIFSSNGEKIAIDNNQFLMPNSSVFVYTKVSLKEEEKKNTHNVFINLTGEVMLALHEKHDTGEKVSINLPIEESYEIEKIEVKNEKNETLNFNIDSFIMPDSDIFINVKLKKKKIQSHQIFSVPADGISVIVASQKNVGEQVEFSYFLNPEYELESMGIYTKNGDEIKPQNNTFIMPDNDVVLLFSTKKKIPNSNKIDIAKNNYITIHIPNEKKQLTNIEKNIIFTEQKLIMNDEKSISNVWNSKKILQEKNTKKTSDRNNSSEAQKENQTLIPSTSATQPSETCTVPINQKDKKDYSIFCLLLGIFMGILYAKICK